MKPNLSLLMAAGAIAFAPAATLAAPPGGGGGGAGAMHGPMNGAPAMQRAMPTARPTTTTTTTTTAHSQTGNGGGYNHLNSPQHATGQPGQDCEELIASGEGSFPGQAGENGKSAFGGTAGDKYAGSQPQNSRNTASVSQYDTACARPQ
jgi:hypothetical protein